MNSPAEEQAAAQAAQEEETRVAAERGRQVASLTNDDVEALKSTINQLLADAQSAKESDKAKTGQINDLHDALRAARRGVATTPSADTDYAVREQADESTQCSK